MDTDKTFKCFITHNPLKLPDNLFYLYSNNVSSFVFNVNSVLLNPWHRLSVVNIRRTQLYPLTKVCLDLAFTPGQMVDIRDKQILRFMANDLLETVVRDYISSFGIKKRSFHQSSLPLPVPQCISHGPEKPVTGSLKSYLPLKSKDEDSVPLSFYSFLSKNHVICSSTVPSHPLPSSFGTEILSLKPNEESS